MKDGYHSLAYHRFFEDYTEKIVEENGKIKIKRVYMGDFYQEACSGREKTLRKIVEILLYLLAVAAYIFGATRKTHMNAEWFVAVSQAITLLGLFWFLFPFLCSIKAKEKLTLQEYRDESVLPKTISLVITLGFVCIDAAVLYALIHDMAALREWILLVPFFIGTAAAAALYGCMKRTKYIKIPASS